MEKNIYHDAEFMVEAIKNRMAELELAIKYCEENDCKQSLHENHIEMATCKAALSSLNSKPDYFVNRIETNDAWGPETVLRVYETHLDATKSMQDHGGVVIELYSAPPVQFLSPDYLQGHADAREWSAQNVEACHPQTGDWVYDDNAILAEVLRKGPEMPEDSWAS